MNVQQQQSTSLTRNRDNKLSERMLTGNGLVTKWSDQKHTTAGKYPPNIIAIPVLEEDKTRDSIWLVWTPGKY